MEHRAQGNLRDLGDGTLDGLRLFEAVQPTWNLLEPSAGPTLSQARMTPAWE